VGAVREDGGHGIEPGRLLDAPVEPQDEVAVLLRAPEVLVAGRLGAGVVVDDAVEDLPVAVVAGGHLPVGEVFAVEEGGETVLRGSGRESEEREKEETFHSGSRA